MRSDHIQQVNSIAAGLSVALRELIEEHRRQINTASSALPLVDMIAANTSAVITDDDKAKLTEIAAKFAPRSADKPIDESKIRSLEKRSSM